MHESICSQHRVVSQSYKMAAPSVDLWLVAGHIFAALCRWEKEGKLLVMLTRTLAGEQFTSLQLVTGRTAPHSADTQDPGSSNMVAPSGLQGLYGRSARIQCV